MSCHLYGVHSHALLNFDLMNGLHHSCISVELMNRFRSTNQFCLTGTSTAISLPSLSHSSDKFQVYISLHVLVSLVLLNQIQENRTLHIVAPGLSYTYLLCNIYLKSFIL